MSGPKLEIRKGKGIKDPLDGRSKLYHKRLEEDLERIKADPNALTEYCNEKRKELGSKYEFQDMKNAMESHILSMGAGIKRKSATGESTSVKLKLTKQEEVD